MKYISIVLAGLATFAASASKPKYGNEITLLSKSHEYVQKNASPDYWALSPYYVGQRTDSSCSIAVASAIVNGARANRNMKSTDDLATHAGVLKRLNDGFLEKNVAHGGDGITLDQMKNVIENSLKIYDVGDFVVKEYRTPVPSKSVAQELHDKLVENEKSSRNFIIANFIQGILTGDAMIGHFAAIGAYDAQSKRVLIMDPDREWYEPYWVSEETLLKAMSKSDKAAPNGRGYLFIQLDK